MVRIADARSSYDGDENILNALETPLAFEPLRDQDPFGSDEPIVAERSSRVPFTRCRARMAL